VESAELPHQLARAELKLRFSSHKDAADSRIEKIEKKYVTNGIS
jgi:hypothetical protein